MTPLLAKAARFPKYRVIAQLDARADALDDSIRRFVGDKAARYFPRARLARRRTR